MSNARVTEVHNRLSGQIVKQIVKETLEAGGDFKAVFVLLESVVAGVILSQMKFTGDQMALDLLIAGVRQRLAELRLAGVEPQGRS